MRSELQQKRRNFEITEILKRLNFAADAERGDANRGTSVHIDDVNYNKIKEINSK